jgi:glycosyltransferase involved in cell wall biosynthesis
MKKSHFFTVVIPTYNRADLVKETIESVLSQTFKDFELIVVDDHSSDNTKEIVESFNDKRIIYALNDRRKGASGARNTGIFMANGSWVAFLDSDDIWLPEKLEMVYSKIQQSDETVGLIYNGLAYYDFDKNREVKVVVPAKEGYVQSDLFISNFIGTYSVVTIQTELLLRVNGCDETIYHSEDTDLYMRILGLCKIAFIDKTLTYYRYTNTDRLTTKWDQKEKLNAYIMLTNKYRSILNDNPRVNYFNSKRLFVTALAAKEWLIMLKALPWTLAGLIYDRSHAFQVIRKAIFCKKS